MLAVRGRDQHGGNLRREDGVGELHDDDVRCPQRESRIKEGEGELPEPHIVIIFMSIHILDA